MNKLVTGVLVCLLSAHCWGAAQPTTCSKLWAGLAELKESDEPLWAVPAVPDEGLLPKLKMSALVHPDGIPFIPRNIEESNCFLDRILDGPTREALVAGGKRAARDRSAVDMDQKLEALQRELDASLRRAAGLSDTAEGAAYSSIVTNLKMLYGVRPSPVDDAGPFQSYAYSQGLYSGHTITWYILVAYLDDHGVSGIKLPRYVEYFRKREAPFAPPENTAPEGCRGGIDYRWPHIRTRLPGQDDFPEEDDVHFGICRATGRVWSYHYQNGWREVEPSLHSELCRLWARDDQFASLCSRVR